MAFYYIIIIVRGIERRAIFKDDEVIHLFGQS